MECKQRKDVIDEATISQIQSFYRSNEISKPRPEKKFKCHRLMSSSLMSAYHQYNIKFPQSKIGYTKFVALRPPDVIKLTRKHHFTCACVYCINVELKLEKLSEHLPTGHHSNRLRTSITSNDSLIDAVLCSKSQSLLYHRPKRLQRSC